MLSFEINEEGGVQIKGTRDELCTLAVWIITGSLDEEAYPAYVSDKGLTMIEIQRTSE